MLVVMRIVLLLLVLGSAANAQDCDLSLIAGSANMDLSVAAAQEEKWSAAAYYSEEAFAALLIAAYSYCEGEKINLAHQLLEELRDIDGRVNCAYHSTQANVASIRSKLAFEKLEDPHQALRHAKESAFYIKEALKWCVFSQEKIDAISGAKRATIETIKQIEDYIEEFGEESITEFSMKFKLNGH